MTTIRANLLRYLRTPLWGYQALRPLAKRAVVILGALTLILDSLFRVTSGNETSLVTALLTASISVALALFAWRPPIAAVILIVTALTAAVTAAPDSLLAGAAILGLVVLTCSAQLTAAYAVAWIAWLASVLVSPGEAFQPLGGIVIAIVSMVSLSIGIAIRQQSERAQTLAIQLEATEREVAEQLRNERDLIADELHDIVAHEITIVALHAAVLERTQDQQTRSQSQTAIREAAVQALTDIRRVLGMVRGEESLSPDRIPSPDGVHGAIEAVTKELQRSGVHVDATVPDDLRLSGASAVALSRVIRESGTNVLKHATGARNVRIDLAVERGWAHLTFADDSPPAQTAGLPTSGYGIVRLRERFRLFGGSFSAERGATGWVVSAALPLEA